MDGRGGRGRDRIYFELRGSAFGGGVWKGGGGIVNVGKC